MKTLSLLLIICGFSVAAMAQEKPFPKDTQGAPNRIHPADTQKIIEVPMDTVKTKQLNKRNQNPIPENTPKKDDRDPGKDPKKNQK